MKRILPFLVLLMTACGTSNKVVAPTDLAKNQPIDVRLDLTETNEDKVPVWINPGRFTTDSVTFRMPRVVQGTYAVSDFGKYIDDLKVYNYEGEEIESSKIDTNTWSIPNATQVDKISYWVNDTFDQETVGGIGEEHPFSPSGTNIEDEVYVLNLHGFIGYFDELKSNAYQLNITSPATFSRTSALKESGVQSGPMGKTLTSSYHAKRYFDITDNPMMFGKLDVEEFQVGDITVALNIYSPNEVHSAAKIKEVIFKMMEGQKAYLGDLNTTSHYDIFLYLSSMEEGAPKGFGALEHHTSTVVVLPESTPFDALAKSMTDVVSHEFFHIVSPLTLHSEDVHYFDYNNPTFSKHLWLYEGVTEYFANHFQVAEGLIDEGEFYKRILDKIKLSLMMDDTMSFTEMSENVLEKPYADNYINVYQKGALIGMCIDILLREESHGEKGILWLMKSLSDKYGIDLAFEDDKLFEEITAMTYPSVGAFFEAHVIGKTPIDYKSFFKKAGLVFEESKIETNYIMNAGQFIFQPNMETQQIVFSALVKDNSFWNDLGVQPGDVVKKVSDQELTMQNAQQIFTEMYMWQPGQEIKVVLEREGEEVLIETETVQSYTLGEKLVNDPEASPAQVALREAWLKG